MKFVTAILSSLSSLMDPLMLLYHPLLLLCPLNCSPHSSQKFLQQWMLWQNWEKISWEWRTKTKQIELRRDLGDDSLARTTHDDHHLGRREAKKIWWVRPGKSTNVDWNREKGADDLFSNYFAPNLTCSELVFPRRLRMSSRLLKKILCVVCAHDIYFEFKHDVAGKAGMCPHIRKLL